MKRKERSITLIEIMIVILLIGLIGGALAFNMRGSIDEGKAFKSEQNISRLHDVLMMEYANGTQSLKEIYDNHLSIVQTSPFSTGSSILKGGWNEALRIAIDVDNDELIVFSDRLEAYRAKKKLKFTLLEILCALTVLSMALTAIGFQGLDLFEKSVLSGLWIWFLSSLILPMSWSFSIKVISRLHSKKRKMSHMLL